ncbi:MAG TPA: hypothetical protein VHT00_19745, partial [Stellaceae bacterium]|nr:hypothetical protein [Stellaceae bacterium]
PASYIMSVSRSKYVVCTPWDSKPFDLDIFAWQDKPDGYFFNYWVRIFKEFEKCSSLSGLTFYLVSNHILVNERPSYGDAVVAVIKARSALTESRGIERTRFRGRSGAIVRLTSCLKGSWVL